MSGKPRRESAFIASRSIEDRKALSRDFVEQNKEGLIESIANGQIYSVGQFTDKFHSYAQQFSENILFHLDPKFCNSFKKQFEFDCAQCKYAFKRLKSLGKSEIEALRLIKTILLPKTGIFRRLPEYGLPEIHLERIVHMRSYSNLALETLAVYSGREPESLRKLIRTSKEDRAWSDIFFVVVLVVLSFLSSSCEKTKKLFECGGTKFETWNPKKMKQSVLEDWFQLLFDSADLS